MSTKRCKISVLAVVSVFTLLVVLGCQVDEPSGTATEYDFTTSDGTLVSVAAPIPVTITEAASGSYPERSAVPAEMHVTVVTVIEHGGGSTYVRDLGFAPTADDDGESYYLVDGLTPGSLYDFAISIDSPAVPEPGSILAVTIHVDEGTAAEEDLLNPAKGFTADPKLLYQSFTPNFDDPPYLDTGATHHFFYATDTTHGSYSPMVQKPAVLCVTTELELAILVYDIAADAIVASGFDAGWNDAYAQAWMHVYPGHTYVASMATQGTMIEPLDPGAFGTSGDYGIYFGPTATRKN